MSHFLLGDPSRLTSRAVHRYAAVLIGIGGVLAVLSVASIVVERRTGRHVGFIFCFSFLAAQLAGVSIGYAGNRFDRFTPVRAVIAALVCVAAWALCTLAASTGKSLSPAPSDVMLWIDFSIATVIAGLGARRSVGLAWWSVCKKLPGQESAQRIEVVDLDPDVLDR